MDALTQDALRHAAATYPYPIAVRAQRLLARPPASPSEEWERLANEIAVPVMRYLSHLMLADLAASGRQPALHARIRNMLVRSRAGDYVGFLREAARSATATAIPELSAFLLSHESLLSTLLEYRNPRSHRLPGDEEAAAAVIAVRSLTASLLRGIDFLRNYPLVLADGTVCMGADAKIPAATAPHEAIRAGTISLHPLVVKLHGSDVFELIGSDLDKPHLAYLGTTKHVKLRNAPELAAALRSLVERLRSDHEWLDDPDWSSFARRAAVVTADTVASYTGSGKYPGDGYAPRPAWEGADGVFARFLASERTLLACSGEQGSGKSALATHLARRAAELGHATLFLNAQRLTFAEVGASQNPIPEFLAAHLRYRKTFDRAAIARILRGRPAGAQVVLFIDALNEIDGLDERWNMLLAIREVLEWAAAAAQRDLKIVLTFRLDAYEELGGLRSDEIPAGIDAIAFGGNNPRQPWIRDLEPFGEEEARSVFESLRAKPQLAMAPAMSWDELREGAGAALAELAANPLVFTIFLRLHHGERGILTTDREELFARYGARVTGAEELTRRPWWRRALGFLRNANVMPKERLLADVVERMAEEGGPAFLVEELDPRNQRDRRLLAAIDAAPGGVFDELLDAGVLTVEIGQNSKGSFRRIGAVAEAVSERLGYIASAIERRQAILFGLILFLVGTVSILAFGRPMQASLLRQANAIQARIARWNFGSIEAIAIMVFATLGFLTARFTHRTARYERELPFVSRAAVRSLKRGRWIALRNIFVPAITIGFAATLLLFLTSARLAEAAIPMLIVPGPIVAEIALLLLVFSPHVSLVLTRTAGLRMPARLIRAALSKYLARLDAPDARRESLRSVRFGVVMLAAAIAAFFILRDERVQRGLVLTTGAVVDSFFALPNPVWTGRNRSTIATMASFYVLPFALVAISTITQYALARLDARYLRLLLPQAHLLSRPISRAPFLAIIVLTVPIGIVIPWRFVQSRDRTFAEAGTPNAVSHARTMARNRNVTAAIQRKCKGFEPEFSWEHIAKLTIHGAPPPLRQCLPEESFETIERLTLNVPCGAAVDLSQFPNLEEVAAPSHIVSRPALTAGTWRITRTCDAAVPLRTIAPAALHVEAPEDVLRALGGAIEVTDPNMVLIVTPAAGETELRLDWLTGTLAQPFVEARARIADDAPGAPRVRRLVCEWKSLSPRLLARMTDLQTLTVLNTSERGVPWEQRKPDRGWLRAVRSGLPVRLRYLESDTGIRASGPGAIRAALESALAPAPES